MLCQICLDIHAMAGTLCMHVACVLPKQTLPLFDLINKLSSMMPDCIMYELLAMAYIPTACNETLSDQVVRVCIVTWGP